MKVIVISPKKSLAAQVRQALTGAGEWEIVWAPSVEEARPAIDNRSLVILDYEKDGETPLPDLEQVQNMHRFCDASVLLIGNKAAEDRIKTSLADCASGYVLKPFTEAALKAKIQEVLRPAGARQRVDVSLINPFIKAAIEIMKTATQVAVQRKEVFLKKNYRMFGDVSGVMGLSGEAVGSVVISMPARLACVLVGKMLGEAPATEVNDSVRDGVGELVNMVAGHAKAALAGSPYHFTLSLPVVVTGLGHEIAHKSGAPCLVVVLTADKEEFAIQVSLSPE